MQFPSLFASFNQNTNNTDPSFGARPKKIHSKYSHSAREKSFSFRPPIGDDFKPSFNKKESRQASAELRNQAWQGRISGRSTSRHATSDSFHRDNRKKPSDCTIL
jgi:hypothetical protein